MTKDAMASQSSGHAPGTSTAARPTASSSSDNTIPIANGGRQHDVSLDPTVQNTARQRRQRPKSSGGFLVETISSTASQPKSFGNKEPDVDLAVKGKGRAEDGGLSIPKRSSARHRHRLKTSVGSSPLATEISNSPSTVEPEGYGGFDPNKRSSMRFTADQSTRSTHSSGGTAIESRAWVHDGASHAPKSAIGHDTDPAQIVNLALHLSENRRRHFSGGGILAPNDPVSTRRVTSSGPPSLALPNSTSGGSLRQYLQQQRQASRNVSPRSSKSARSKGGELPSIPRSDENRLSTSLSPLGSEFSDDSVFSISDATLSRVQKAQLYMELSYEYRRLLQYLPPLPVSTKLKGTSDKGETKKQDTTTEELGRAYNPVQYIRNRKVRYRQRRSLNPEADGWKDLQSVRIWVNAVAREREQGIPFIDHRSSLPKFESLQGSPSLPDSSQASPHSDDHRPRKSGRPRMDWEFMPWDLLADVHWLDQDGNIKHIEDSNGNKIVKAHQIHKADQPRSSKESTRSSMRRPESVGRYNFSPDRTRNVDEHVRTDSKDRGRRNGDSLEPSSPIDTDNGPAGRRSRWPRRLVRSRSSSSSNESHIDLWERHTRGHKHTKSRNHPDNAALEKQMLDMLAKEEEDNRRAKSGSNASIEKRDGSGFIENGDNVRTSKETTRRPSAPQRMRTDLPPSERRQPSPRPSLDEQRLHDRQMSSDEFDSTAPNSPAVSAFIPSIAINLSPTESPSTSGMPSKKLPSRLGSFRRTRSRSVNRPPASDNELATESQMLSQISRQTTNESEPRKRLQKARLTDSDQGLLSPTKNDTKDNRLYPVETISIRSVKDSIGSESRFRGLLKGGRIAEIVGNEVSKVGDMLWRKDSSYEFSQIASPASSYASEESDVDDGDISGLDSSPNYDLSRVTTYNDDVGKPSQGSTPNEKPKYFMNNLPTFRSSLHKDEKSLTSNEDPRHHDHISRQQLQQRERGRSSRFDALAPPKIDLRGISPSPSSSPSFTRGTRPIRHEESRQSSSSRSNGHVHHADRRLNEMLGIPGKAKEGPSPTGLAAFESAARPSNERPNLEKTRQWSISDRGVSAVPGTINTRDIARVRALLLSSGIKANEIARRGDEIPDKPSQLLQSLRGAFQGPPPRVPRSQEHVVAARALVNTIGCTAQQLSDTADSFSRGTVDSLRDQIKELDDRATYKLTPLVRASADDADAFSTELTTTRTLAVKQLNDSVDTILRRRRRRLRYIGRAGWAVLEWTVLTIMWMVWFIVVVVRLIRGAVRGFVKGVKWLLWL